MNPIVAAWRVPQNIIPMLDVYEVVRADGSVWRWRDQYWSDVADEMIPASGWFRVAPPLTESENAEEV